MKHCVFSADRKYRYLLVHRWEPELMDRHCMWIALNPSIADESGLDNTLARIRSFSGAAGFNAFYMVNLFGLVSTNRKALKHHPDPVGPDTDSHIRRIATLIPTIFVAWGPDGRHQNRARKSCACSLNWAGATFDVLAPTKMAHLATHSISRVRRSRFFTGSRFRNPRLRA